ncbi:hypothetical protein BGZ63DRAFT_344999 [Mariannaea sp. PMI_226]|nr:hypothetical protein BGZ63DRAFT_344999 [Mariannaea sp. PMI_226]
MRFSSTILAALPALVAAQDPVDQIRTQVRSLLDQASSYLPNPGTYDPVAAAQDKAGPLKMSTLTLENWKDTFYEPVSPDATKPEEWWVLVSGRNKTCFGRCDKVEEAFKETAAKFGLLKDAPHMAYLNCDDQPILCNAWSTAAPNLYIFDVLPSPAPVDVYKKRLNMTTTTSEDFINIYKSGNKEGLSLQEHGWFHPIHGKVVEWGLAVPVAYLVWAFGLVPNWLFMLVVSFVSRSMM